MRALGLDLGTKTLGLALTDVNSTISNPYKTLRYSNYDELLKELKIIIDEYEIGEIVLGLPKNMNNSQGFASERSKEFKSFLEKNVDLPITLVDERLSTVEAERYLLDDDMSRKKRKEHIDAVAASLILDTYIRMKGNKNNGRE